MADALYGGVEKPRDLTQEDEHDISAAIYGRDDALYMPLARKLWWAYLYLKQTKGSAA